MCETTCRLVQLAREREQRDQENGTDRGLWFDAAEADRVPRYFGMLRQYEGEWGGQRVARSLGLSSAQLRQQRDVGTALRRRFQTSWRASAGRSQSTTYAGARLHPPATAARLAR